MVYLKDLIGKENKQLKYKFKDTNASVVYAEGFIALDLYGKDITVGKILDNFVKLNGEIKKTDVVLGIDYSFEGFHDETWISHEDDDIIVISDL